MRNNLNPFPTIADWVYFNKIINSLYRNHKNRSLMFQTNGIEGKWMITSVL